MIFSKTIWENPSNKTTSLVMKLTEVHLNTKWGQLAYALIITDQNILGQYQLNAFFHRWSFNQKTLPLPDPLWVAAQLGRRCAYAVSPSISPKPLFYIILIVFNKTLFAIQRPSTSLSWRETIRQLETRLLEFLCNNKLYTWIYLERSVWAQVPLRNIFKVFSDNWRGEIHQRNLEPESFNSSDDEPTFDFLKKHCFVYFTEQWNQQAKNLIQFRFIHTCEK